MLYFFLSHSYSPFLFASLNNPIYRREREREEEGREGKGRERENEMDMPRVVEKM